MEEIGARTQCFDLKGIEGSSRPVGADVVLEVIAKDIDSLSSRLGRSGYSAQRLAESLDLKIVEMRDFLKGKLAAARMSEIENEMRNVGKAVRLEYTVKETKESNCLPLTATPIPESKFVVSYGQPGSESEVPPTTYSVKDLLGGKNMFCLNGDLVKPGFSLKVRYTAEQADNTLP